jgi:hypothetical protein
MPSLLRVMVIVAILGGLGFGAMYAFATWVEPKPREITVTVPADRFIKPQR